MKKSFYLRNNQTFGNGEGHSFSKHEIRCARIFVTSKCLCIGDFPSKFSATKTTVKRPQFMGLSSKKKINKRFVSTVRVQSVNTFLDYQAHGFFVAIKNQDSSITKKTSNQKANSP